MNVKFEIIKSITNGSFGQIFLGKNKFTNEYIAIKRENKDKSSVKNEAKIYNYLNNDIFFPKLKDFIVDKDYNYLILELLNYNLSTLQGKINKEQIKNIGIQMFNIIEFLHGKGIVHRDIKPNNFLLSSGKVKLIDFGFAKKIIDKKHIEFKKIDNIIGTPNYISLNVHNLIEPSRRDDIESIIYILIYLVIDLPWRELSLIETKNLKEELFHINMLPKLCKELLELCRNLQFSQDPPYLKIKQIIEFSKLTDLDSP